MATLHSDLSEFFDDLATDLTNLHVTAAAYQMAPTDQKAVDALAKIPAGLIDRAQALKARLDESDDDAKNEPKPKAKPSSSSSSTKR